MFVLYGFLMVASIYFQMENKKGRLIMSLPESYFCLGLHVAAEGAVEHLGKLAAGDRLVR